MLLAVVVLAGVAVSTGTADPGGHSAATRTATSEAPLAPLDSSELIDQQRRDDARRRKSTARNSHRDADLTDSEAVSTLKRRIPGFMGRRLAPSLSGARGKTVRRYLGANRAIVREDGKNALVQSMVPLRLRPGGDPKKDPEPVDAAIVPDGAVLRPKNTPSVFELAPATDSQHDLADRSVLRFPKAKFGIRLADGADGAAGGKTIEDKIVYPNVGKDTDLVLASIATAAQALYALRSSAAPEDIAFEVTGPQDIALREAKGRLGIEVVRDRKVIGRIQAPVAFDATDRRVVLTWAIDGRKVRMHVAHRHDDVFYPVMVDPVVVDDQRFWVSNGALDFNGWAWRSTDGNGSLFPHVMGYGFYGTGLTIYQDSTKTYPAGSRGQWQFAASGDPAHPTEMAHISSADFGYTAHLPAAGTGSCMFQSIAYQSGTSWIPEPQGSWRVATPVGQPILTQAAYDPTYGFYNCNTEGTYGNVTTYKYRTHCLNNPCPIGGLDTTRGHAGNAAVLTMLAGTGKSTQNGLVFMGASLITQGDQTLPNTTGSATNTNWIDGPATINATGTDYGFGLTDLTLTGPDGAIASTPQQNCDRSALPATPVDTPGSPNRGDRNNKCAFSLTQGITVPANANTQGKSVQAVSTDLANNTRTASIPTKIDFSPPTATMLSNVILRPGGTGDATTKTFSVRLADQYSGVKNVTIAIDGGTPETITQPTCTAAQCPTSYDVALPAARIAKLTTGNHRVDVIVDDAIPQGTDAALKLRHHLQQSFDFVVFQDAGTTLPPGTDNVGRKIQGGLGFEDFYTYDTTPTGAGSNLRVNLATGGTSWAVTPVSNPGIGLDSVFRLTYNSYEPAGLLPGLLGTGITGYNQTGLGFSAQLGSITRVNEPLWFETDLGLPLGQADLPTAVKRIVMTDGDGTQQEFKRNSRPGVQFDPPPGVELKFRLFSSSDPTRRWAATRPDGTTFFFDSDGLPSFTKDRHGNQIKIHYATYMALNGCGFVLTCNKRVDRVVDAAGLNPDGTENASADARAWTVTYDAQNHITQIQDRKRFETGNPQDRPRRITSLGYNTDTGQLTSINEAANAPAGQPKRTFTLGYDPQTKYLTSVRDPNEKTTKVTYGQPPQDLTGLLGELLGGTGLFQNLRPVQGIEDRASISGNRVTKYSLVADGTGHKAYVRDARNNVDEVKTDSRGRMTQLTQGASDNDPTTTEVIPAVPRVTGQTWTGDNYVSSTSQGVGTTQQVSTDYSWGTLGELQTEIEHSGAPGTNQTPSDTSRTRSWGYQRTAGTVLAQDNQDSGDDGKFVYDVTSETDRRGKTTTYGYGTPTEAPLGDVRTIDKDASTHDHQELTYNAQGLLTTHLQNVWNGVANKPTFNGSENATQTERWQDFDQNGDAGTYKDQRDKVTRIGHDEVGNTTFVADPRSPYSLAIDATPPRAAPPAGPEAPAARTTNAVANLGPVRTEAQKTGEAFTARWTYDALDRQVTQAIPKRSSASTDGTDRFRITATTFDLNDNVTSELDGTNQVSTKVYTATDKVKQGSTPSVDHYAPAGSNGEPASTSEAEVTKYAYDVVDNVVERADPLGTLGQSGHHTLWTYDEFDEPIVQQQDHAVPTPAPNPNPTPATLVQSRTYDVRGNVIGEADANGNAANPTTTPAANAADPTKQRTAYEWDPFDRLKNSTDNPNHGISGIDRNLKTSYLYDAEDHLLEKTSPGGRKEKQTYDDAGRLTSRSEPFGYTGSSTTSWAETTWALRADGTPYASTAPRGNDGGAGGFVTRMSYYDTGELKSRQLPRRADHQYGPTLHVDYTINDVGDPIAVTDARTEDLTNTFLDTGELATTTRPSWWVYDQDQGTVRERTDDDPTPKTMTEADLPSESSHGDLGKVDPADLPDVLPAKGLTKLDYDDELRLTSVESRDDNAASPGSITQTMSYDQVGRPTGRTMPLTGSTSIRLRWQYDANGNMRAAYDGRNAASLSYYDDYDRKVTQTDPENCKLTDSGCERPKTEQGYDQNGNVLWENAPAANDPSAQNTGATTGRTSTTYDAVDRPYTTTDASGSTTTTEYDADGLVSKSYAPRAALETTQAGKDRYATSFVYDGAGRVTNQTAKATDTAGPQTLVTDTTYDRDGNIIRVESPGAQKSSSDGGTPPQRVQTRQYDGRDLPWSTTIGTGANRHTTITEYDGNGWLRRTVKPRGVNDDVNPPLPTNDDAQTPFGGNQNRNAETLEYDPGGLLTARNLPWGDGDRAELDADAKRWRQEFSYTPRGVLKTVTGVFDKKGTGTGTPDHTTSVTTNDAGWPTQTVSHDEGSSTSTDVTFDYSYDQQGNQLTWNAGSGRKIRRGYFPSGQMSYRCGVRDSGPGTSEEQIYSYKYDRSGALTNVTDWNHHQVADNGLCDQKAATGADAADNLGSQVTRIGRDKATRPLTVDEKYSPTADRGKDTIYSYKTGTPNLIHTVRTDGLLTSATGAYSGGTQSTFEYDEQDRNTKVTVDSDMPAATKPANRVTDIRFWPSGDQREMLKPAVAGTSRTKESRYYDTAGLISQRTVDPATGTSRSTDYTYDVNGNRTRDERGGTSAGPGYVYNARDQLTSWTRSRNGAAPAETEKDPYKQVTYTLDGSGRQLGTHQIIRADRDDDLFSKITTDVVTTNTYVGDRLTKTDRALKIAKALPIVEIPVQLTDDYQTDCYAYDAMGSQTVAIRHTDTLVTGIPHTTVTCPTDIKAQDNWRTENQNTFDTFERLVASRQRTHPDGNGNDTGTLKNNEAYCYDALDRRDRKLTDLSASQDPGEGDDNPTAFQKARAACTQKQDTDVGVYDFSYLGLTEQLTRENRSTGVQTYEYDATGKRLGRLKAESTGAPTWRAYDTDAQGTVVGLEKSDTGDTTPDDDGKKNTYDIDPYGDPVGSDDDDLSADAKSNPFQYQGFYKDQDTGNYDMQARAYRPSVGQFLQQDRFADPQGDLALAADPLTSSRYAFTAANPSTRSEYNGHDSLLGPAVDACPASRSLAHLLVEPGGPAETRLAAREGRPEG
ncbi:RHS repeat-associated core domain-containing protein, partial [Patulibacter sp. NPDC049589]|uniref:RHS repeat-associated core domain-containing protein n=1 Tax=Patulibacter sp. NPDC049589 TaxID=3154731 RepID=UPI003444920A